MIGTDKENNIECLLQSMCNAKRNAESDAPCKRLIDYDMQSIIKRIISNILVYQNVLSMLQTVASKFHNVWVP